MPSYFRYKPGEEPIPQHVLVERLGVGGFGEVWKARGPGGFLEALKIIDLTGAEGAEEYASLDVVRRLKHPHLVSVHGCWLKDKDHAILPDRVGAAAGPRLQTTAAGVDATTTSVRPVELVIAMDLGEMSLFALLKQRREQGHMGIPDAELLEYMLDAAKAIDWLNQASPPIVHGDIKPHNILLMGGSAQICDFGLCKVVQDIRTTRPTPITVAYASPESFLNKPSTRSDQYSLAITYVELRTGNLPFGDEDQVSPFLLMEAHKYGKLRLDGISPAVRKVVLKATAPDPQQRWPTAKAMVQALIQAEQSHEESAPGATAIPITPLPKSATKDTEHRTIDSATQDTTKRPRATRPRPERREPAPRSRTTARALAVLLAIATVGGLIFTVNQLGHRPTDQASGTTTGLKSDRPAEKSSDSPVAAVPTPHVESPPPPARPSNSANPSTDRGAPQEKPGEVRDDNGLSMKFVYIPAGEFMMGSRESESGHDDSEKQHRVRITRPFYLGAYTVTQSEYKQVVGANPSRFASNDGGNDKDADLNHSRFPVENVSWNDATAFCQKFTKTERQAGRLAMDLRYALPTEAQWEYACRAGTTSAFNIGERISSKQANIRDALGTVGWTTSGGSYKPNAWGLYDMHGNVFQWCADWYEGKYYDNAPVDDPSGPPTGEHRAMRGGCYLVDQRICRSAYRIGFPPTDRYEYLGFRVARVAAEQ